MRVECDPTTTGGQQPWDQWWLPGDDMLLFWAGICPPVSGGMLQCLGSPDDQFWLDQKGYHPTGWLFLRPALYGNRVRRMRARPTDRCGSVCLFLRMHFLC